MAFTSRRPPSVTASVRSDFQDDATNVSAASSYLLGNDRNEYSDDRNPPLLRPCSANLPFGMLPETSMLTPLCLRKQISRFYTTSL